MNSANRFTEYPNEHVVVPIRLLLDVYARVFNSSNDQDKMIREGVAIIITQNVSLVNGLKEQTETQIGYMEKQEKELIQAKKDLDAKIRTEVVLRNEVSDLRSEIESLNTKKCMSKK